MPSTRSYRIRCRICGHRRVTTELPPDWGTCQSTEAESILKHALQTTRETTPYRTRPVPSRYLI